MDTRAIRPLLTVLLVPTLMALLAVAPRSAAQEITALLLTHAVLVDGTGGPAVQDAWVHVEGAQIVAVGRGQPPVVKGARILDLTGRTVVPGLSDMHVHLGRVAQARWMLALLLAQGVTTVKEAGNALGNDADIRMWLKTTPVMPHVFMSGVTLNGDRVAQCFLQPGPAVRRQLEDNRAFGAEFIKLHNFVSSAALKQIVAFGRAHDMPVTGHTPLGMTLVAAIDHGMTILEHVRMRVWEISDDPELVAKYPMDIPLMIREGFWASFDAKNPSAQKTLAALEARRDRFFLDPTLVTQEALAYGDDPQMTSGPSLQLVSPAVRQEWGEGADRYGVMDKEQFNLAKGSVKGMAAFVAAAHARGIRLLTGSDIVVPWVVPGVSLHRELELMVGGGLTSVQVIHASTGVAAQALRVTTRGTIAPGQEADLVIARGDVSADIRAIKDIESVMLGGRIHERRALLAEAARLASQDTAASAAPAVAPVVERTP